MKYCASLSLSLSLDTATECRPVGVTNGLACTAKTHEKCNIQCLQGYEPRGVLTCTEFGSFTGNGTCVGTE